jgi:pyridoxal phosphate enzyme (YggS family)
MNTLEQNYSDVLHKIGTNSNIKLIAVSKTFSSTVIRELYDLGQLDFGENYAQEFSQKTEQLKDLDITWHFIGNIQSNKSKLIATHAHWVHSISSAKQIIKLSNQRPLDMAKLNVLLEVNLSGEENRHGVHNFENLIELANIICSTNNLVFRGLMGIASATDNKQLIESQFQQLKTLFDRLVSEGFNVDTLSMGMSNDYDLAIKCGSTMVRIGSLIFGSRT